MPAAFTRVVARASATEHPRWADLPLRARAWRVVHAGWSVLQLACLAQVWRAVITRRRSPLAWASAGFLAAEGAALVIGKGNCPVGPRQAAWGDPVPFFELLLQPRAAKAAIPVLFVIATGAMAGLVIRAPGLRWRAG
jgi:hypothetical protein